MREQISLNGTWQLKGTASYVPLRDRSMETGKPLEGVTGWMDAQVPGGVARALYQAGYIDHPYVDMNSLKCEWIENRWWIYRREFDRRDIPAHRKTLLHFEGVDYACMVYLNGHLLGKHEGMYEDFAFDVTDLLQTADVEIVEVNAVVDGGVLREGAADDADPRVGRNRVGFRAGRSGAQARLRRRRAASGISGISAPGWSIWASGRMYR